jgi:transposase
MIVREFEKGFSAKQILKRIDLSYPTVLKALEVLRLSIIANQDDSEMWFDLAYDHTGLQIKQEKQGPFIFGIIESDRLVTIEILADLPLKTLLELKPRMLSRSSIYYTDAYRHFSFLLFHDHVRIHDLRRESWRQIPSLSHESDFLKFARRLINRHRGITDTKLPLYLKEIEFRYNHRNQPLFKQLCRFLVSFIPNTR